MTVILGSIVSTPLTLFAKRRPSSRTNHGFMVAAGKDRFDKILRPFKGDDFFCKISGQDNDGDMYVFESTREEEGGPILHTHYSQDEWWYVLEGEFLVKVGDVTYNAKKGDFVYGPRMVPHTFSKIGSGMGRVLIGFQPAGKMEAYFQKLHDGATKNLSDAQREAFRREHGFETSGPALTIEKKTN